MRHEAVAGLVEPTRECGNGLGMAADPNLRLSPELTASTESRIELLAPVAAVERFDDYAIVGKLGVGGMAEVFLALSTGPSGFRKLLVVKRVHAHLGDDPS